MNRIERLFALRGCRTFAGLYDSELAALAAVATARRLEPGAPLLRRGQPLRHLYVVCQGGLVDAGGHPLPTPYGTREILNGGAAAEDVRAAADTGAVCLLIARTHVLTLVHEFPAVLLELALRRPAAHEEETP